MLFCLVLKAKGLNFNLWNQFLGKCLKSIHGTTIKMKSGLLATIKFLRANLEGELAILLMFQYRYFIWNA